MEDEIKAPEDAVPAFSWESWYAAVGGRTIDISEVQSISSMIRDEQGPLFYGPVAEQAKPFSSPSQASSWVKMTAKELGADIVGVCRIEPSDIYRGRTVSERFAIAVGKRMRYSEFQEVPATRSAIECMRIYHDLGETVIHLATALRERGYACRVEHPLGDSNVLHIPIGLKAGFGELGRHGSIINPELGPLFRMGSVLTSLELECDSPIDAGIAKFCDSCRACRIYCPADAIPDERSPSHGVDHLGNPRYVVDTGKCFPYFAKHNYCSACLPVCVYNHKEWARDFNGQETQIFPTVVMHNPPVPCDQVPMSERHDYPSINRDVGRRPIPKHAIGGEPE